MSLCLALLLAVVAITGGTAGNPSHIHSKCRGTNG